MTSATLCAKTKNSNPTGSKLPAEPAADLKFSYIKSRLGVIREKTLALGSPFDYATQATLFIEMDLPEPNDTLRFLPAACEKIVHYLKQPTAALSFCSPVTKCWSMPAIV